MEDFCYNQNMALDNSALKIIVDKLKEDLVGAFFDHSFNLTYTHFALPYHSSASTENKGRGTLIVSMDSGEPFLTYSFEKFTKVTDNSAFSNILKRVAGTKLVSIEKTLNERVVTLTTEVINPTIDDTVTSYDLVVELVPQQPNFYILDHSSQRIIAMYKEHGDILSPRYMSRGLTFIPLKPREARPHKIAAIDELRPYFSRAVLAYFEDYASKVGFEQALTEIDNSRELYVTAKGIMPISFGKTASKIEVKNIYAHYVADQKKVAGEIKEKKLKELLAAHLKTATKKLNNLQHDAETSKKRLIYKDYGQILYLYQTEYDGKLDKLIRDGYAIPIDRDLSYVANANIYFKKYRKAKLAVPILEKLISQTKNDIEYLEKKLLDIANGSPRDILELKSELIETGYIKGIGKKANKKTSSKKIYDPHYLLLERGKIGYGMNDLQNETLTFALAPIHALFFHVVDHSGAHVVLLSGMENLAYRELAAELALFISHLEAGDVYMAEVKDVKKNKAKKGLVNILKYETVTIHKIKETSLELFASLK